MKSSEGRGGLAAWIVIGLCAASIRMVQPALAAKHHSLKVTSDTYSLGTPEQTIVASLGYRSAFADYLFGNLLVQYGLHFQEKRRLEFIGDYIDTINTLDPKFRDPYRYADTLLVFSPEPPRLSDYVKARQVLERGLSNRPFDTELWLTAGQFLAYLAWPYVPEEMQPEWKLTGGKYLARACELQSNNENISYNCLVAATLLDASGERDAAIEALKRTYSVTDDPEIQKIALAYLGKKLSERESELQEQRKSRFRKLWQSDLPFISKDMLLLLGPPVDTAACAGAQSGTSPDCATTFRDWAKDAEQTP